MPIIDEREIGSDRARRTSVWPWVLVAVGASLIWLLIAGLLSVLPGTRETAAGSPQAVRQLYAEQVARAKEWSAQGHFAGAVGLYLALPADAEMDALTKHDYLVDGLRAFQGAGHAGRAVELGERLFRYSLRLRTQECAECHGAGKTHPLTLQQLPSGSSGLTYRRAVQRAPRADEVRRRLEKAVTRNPDDLGTLIPLLALEEGRDPDSRRTAELTQRLAVLAAKGERP